MVMERKGQILEHEDAISNSSSGDMSSPEPTTSRFKRRASQKLKLKKSVRADRTIMMEPVSILTSIIPARNFEMATKTDGKAESTLKNNGGKLECNIALLGELGVGKTALAVRFVTGRYLHEYDTTLERTYEKSIKYCSETVMVRLWDTVTKTWEMCSEQANGFLVLCSLTSPSSALHAQNIISSIRSSPFMKNTPIMLLGNKSELVCGRKVSEEEMERFATSNECSYKEISVACTNNIDPVVKLLVKQILLQEGGRLTPSALRDDSKSGLSRKPSNAKHKMKRFLSKKIVIKSTNVNYESM